MLKDDEPLFSYHFGVQTNGNVKAEFDIQGELVGKASIFQHYCLVWRLQNILRERYTIFETAEKYSKRESEVQSVLGQAKKVLKAYRDEHRPRPHLDDKVGSHTVASQSYSNSFQDLDSLER